MQLSISPSMVIQRVRARTKRFIFLIFGRGKAALSPPVGTDVREEYANAFRTESYNEFWTRVLALSDGNWISGIPVVDSTTAARLPSYRLLVEHLLDPDPLTVTRILESAHNPPKTHSLLSDYFSQTAQASVLCGLLLKDIDRTRIKYRSLNAILQSMDNSILTRLADLVNSLIDPFPRLVHVRAIQADCSKLLKSLELSRDKTRAKLHLKSKLKHGSALFLVALTASLTTILATHALALVVAAPSIISMGAIKLASSRKLARISAQLDMAAKGTYILGRDLETISRLVARLNNEMEHMKATVKFWQERGEAWVQADGEVMRQLKKNDCSFREQLDELEEHLYLCFMTINRARNLVLKQVMDPTPSHKAPNVLFQP